MKEPKSIELTEVLAKLKPVFDLLCHTGENCPFVVDTATHIALVSPKLRERFHLSGEVLTGFNDAWIPLIYPEDKEAYIESIGAMLRKEPNAEHNMTYRVKAGSGEYVWIHCHAAVDYKSLGMPVFAGYITLLDSAVYTDSATGLLNENTYELKLKEILEEKEAEGLAMIFRLSDFSFFSAACPVKMTDALLREVGAVMEGALKEKHIVYKLEGADYGMVFLGRDHAYGEQIYKEVETAVSKFCEQRGWLVESKGKSQAALYVTAGGVLFPSDGREPESLLHNMRAALEMANPEEHRCCFFSEKGYAEWLRKVFD